MELDIWIPEYNLALEYQGEHHYYDIPKAFGPKGNRKLYSERDEIKKKACATILITLLPIPYWWDGSMESLGSTLHKILPTVFTEYSEFAPIPIQPPTPLNRNNMGDESISLSLMHGQDWQEGHDPYGWYISEKLDGIRAFWDGNSLFSRKGIELPAPSNFTENLPRGVPLDGELWLGYDSFYHLTSIFNRSYKLENEEDLSKLWKNITFCVFDVPGHSGSYLDRYLYAQQSILESCPRVRMIPVTLCLGYDHLRTLLSDITIRKGEGIMLYHPESKYYSGRTSHLLKIKINVEETVQFLKCSPNSYSFICEQSNGKRSIVKCSGWDYTNPPKAGTTLTVRHLGYHKQSQKMKHPLLLKIHPTEF